MPALEQLIRDKAKTLGFDLVGFARAEPADDFDAYAAWLDRGYAGEMGYLCRRAGQRRHPASVLPTVRSVVMVALNYANQTSAAGNHDAGSGRAAVARYARGGDYHRVLWDKLDALLAFIREQVPQAEGRGVVDTAPLLERGLARRAGLGWVGKNTMLLSTSLGSYFFLGALLLNIDLTPDSPFQADHCGTCTACLDACPTAAFPAPRQLDARRCVSYLTIELRGPMPSDLRPDVGKWLFGCDVCQEVCPWNHKAPEATETPLLPRPEFAQPDPLRWLNISEDDYRRTFRGTALTRAKRAGLRRNAAIVLGNIGSKEALPALAIAAADDDPTIRDAAAWAIEQINGRTDSSQA